MGGGGVEIVGRCGEGEGGIKNHENLISWGKGLGNYLKLRRLFWFLSKIFLFIYTKWVYVSKPCVRRNFSQKLIAGGVGEALGGWGGGQGGGLK